MLDNIEYLETLYKRYRANSESVAPEWRDYFGAEMGGNGDGKGHAALAPGRLEREPRHLDEKVHQLIRNYRVRGHKIAAIDPLGAARPCPPELKLEFYNFTSTELETPVNLPTLNFGGPLTIREIFEHLQNTYSRSIGVQFMHVDDWEARQWLQQRMESTQNRLAISREQQARILTRLTDAVVFEEFLRKKFPGAKTFSLEGCETLLPLLDLAIERAAAHGARDMVIGMAHRGRLNVLAHIAGKSAFEIFREFADAEPELWEGRGDVKYHLGHAGNWTTSTGRDVHVSLCFNPSHLEFINPIVLGRARARQDRLGDAERREVLSLLIHGDAAFAGEGVVQETLNLSRLKGYSVGGTLHVILNNQIGFTTTPQEGRSTVYATDAARMLQSPIFHVNGEDPEAVAQVVLLAMDYRHEFQCDVFIDMFGYRRWGHNETDEPSFTQPVLYRRIDKRKSVREGYYERLKEMGGIDGTEAERIARDCRDRLEQELAAAKNGNAQPAVAGNGAAAAPGVWRDYTGGPEPADDVETGIAPERVAALLRQLAETPSDFHVHPKLERALQTRREMAEGRHPLDWAAAEMLALASLADEGVRIRLAGQDTARGTFSHRHAIFYDYESGLPFSPLQHLSPKQGPVEIVNSPLCETGALGFEYGYSLDCPGGLILWEAQFGDFINVAQVILDQFICSAEDKWRRLSGLVLLLPHGFEGMGPEHSSARLERFMALAAGDNIQVAQPTTPAQYFHLLRRQAVRKWRKPLVVFTPKSLLRHPRVVSPLEQFIRGTFERILPERAPNPGVRRVLLCSGKIHYELLAYQEEHKRQDVALLRLEQLYPIRDAALETMLNPYADQTPVLWVQEEPHNMGAWRYLHEKFGKHLFGRWPFALVSRPESASPATGSAGAHKLEQQKVIRRAFGDGENPSPGPLRHTAASARLQEE